MRVLISGGLGKMGVFGQSRGYFGLFGVNWGVFMALFYGAFRGVVNKV
jgi:hypothetical protein